MNEQILVTLMMIGFLSTMSQLVAWWVKIPSILFLLLAGIIAGPITGYLSPDKLFGDLLFPVVALAVAIILFEGSLTLKFSQIKGHGKSVLIFIFCGAIITWTGVTATAHYLLSLDWHLSALIGAILIVTGPTVIMPILRAVHPTAKIANMLKWEGIIIDPFGALFAILVFDLIISGQDRDLFDTFMAFIQMIGVGAAVGFAGGYILAEVLRRHWLPDFLINILVLNSVLLLFVISDSIYHETGLLTVTIMGLYLGNAKHVDLEEILSFKETMSTLLISGLFIVLGARVTLAALTPVITSAIILFIMMQFLIRPIKVFATTYKSSLTWQEKAFISWVAPRGIVAAAIASLFEIRLIQMGYPGAEIITPLIFLIILFTVIIPSLTAGILAKFLNVAAPETGILMLGASQVGRKVAKILEKHDIQVTLADTSWENISSARLDGLTTYYGNPTSEYADFNLNTIGIGKLLSITPNTELSVIAGLRFSKEFGKKNIFYLQTGHESNLDEKYRISKQHRGTMLFTENLTYQKLNGYLDEGAEIRSTTLSDKFSYEDYTNKNKGQIIPLFAFDGKDKLHLFAVDKEVKPKHNWTILSLWLNQATE